jgi:hypothetical protein
MRLPRRHKGRHAGPRRRGDSARTLAQVLLPDDPPLRPLRGHLVRAGVRMATRTVVAAAVLVGAANFAPAGTSTDRLDIQAPTRAQRELMQRYDCSPDGFGDGSTPRSAIIRSDGELEVVSFDRGWRVYTGQGPQALVAICLDPPR